MKSVVQGLVLSGLVLLLGACNIKNKPRPMVNYVENIQILPFASDVEDYNLDRIVNIQCLCEFIDLSYKPFGQYPKQINQYLAIEPEFVTECILRYWTEDSVEFYKLQQRVAKGDNEISSQDVKDFLDERRSYFEKIIVEEVKSRK